MVWPKLQRGQSVLLCLAGIAIALYLIWLAVEWSRLETSMTPTNQLLLPQLSETMDAVETGFTGQVVKIIHQSWVDKRLPKMFSSWSKSFPKCFPDYEYKLWTDKGNRKLIAKHYPWFLPRYDSYGAGVQKASASRLFYMYHYGGVYCDLDCECLKNFQHLLVNTSLVFGAMRGLAISNPSDPAYVAEGQIDSSFMYSRPRHPFVWDLIMRLNSTTEGMAVMSSGSRLIMSGIHTARKLGVDRLLVDHRPFFTIYPPQLFNPYSWIYQTNHHCHLFGRFTNEQLQRCRSSFPKSYIVQYHTQAWGKVISLPFQ